MSEFKDTEKIIYVNVSSLKPHPKNEKLLPKLTIAELKRLKDRIKKYGFTESIEITKEGYVLDGNNRVFKILVPYKDELAECGIDADKVPARIIDIEKDEEENYIISKNFDRRHLSKLMQSYIRGTQYNELKKSQGGTGANQYKEQSAKKCHSAKTASVLANKFSMAESTIRNDGNFAKLCENLILYTNYDFVFELLNGEIKANKSLIIKLSKEPKVFIENVFDYYKAEENKEIPLKEVMENIKNGKNEKSKKTYKKIIFEITDELGDKLEILSKKKGIDKDKLIEELLENALENLKD